MSESQDKKPERFIEVGGKCGDYFRRNIIFPLSESKKAMQTIIEKTNKRDAYYCVYFFDQKDRKKGTKYLAPLYFDIDGDIHTDAGYEDTRMAALSLIQILQSELRLKLNEISVFFSGSKGFHIMVPSTVLKIPFSSKLNLIYKSFILYLQTKVEHGKLMDTKIYDNKRLIRIPNTINEKTGLYKVAVTASQLRSFTKEQLLEYAKEPKPILKIETSVNQEAATRFLDIVRKTTHTAPQRHTTDWQIPTEIKKLPMCMKVLLSTQIQKGGRNNMLALLASVLIQNGYQGEKAISVLQTWNYNNEEPLEDKEVLQTYLSAERMAKEGKRYGCTSIREQGLFAPRQLCTKCPIYLRQQEGAHHG